MKNDRDIQNKVNIKGVLIYTMSRTLLIGGTNYESNEESPFMDRHKLTLTGNSEQMTPASS